MIFRSDEGKIIALTSFGHSLCHICEMASLALIPAIMLEFGLAADRVALLTVPCFVLFGVGAVPSGYWADKRGTQEAMAGYFLFVIAAAAFIYFSASVWMLTIGLSLLGAAISIYHPVGLAMLSNGCQSRGRAMGINGVAGSLGVAIGPAVGLYAASQYNWRTTYAIIAVLSAIGLVLAMMLNVRVQRRETKPPLAGSGNSKAIAVLAILFAAMLLGGFNYRSVTTVLPSYLSGNHTPSTGKVKTHVDNQSTPLVTTIEPQKLFGETSEAQRTPIKSSLIVFVVFALGGVGQIIGGYLADRVSPSVAYATAICLTIPCALLIAFTGLHLGTWLAGTFAVFMFAEQPLENTMIAEATPPKWRSTIYGLKFILTFGLGSFGAYAAGLVWKNQGIESVFLLYTAGATLMAVLAITFATVVVRSTATRSRSGVVR